MIGPDALVEPSPKAPAESNGLSTFARSPSLIAFGWYRDGNYLAPFGEIVAAGRRDRGFRLVLRLQSLGSKPTTIGLNCTRGDRQRTIVATPSGTTVVIPGSPGSCAVMPIRARPRRYPANRWARGDRAGRADDRTLIGSLATGVAATYLISVRSLNIGRYIEMTMVPTMMPTPIIKIGSMIEVRDWMLASTSSS